LLEESFELALFRDQNFPRLFFAVPNNSASTKPSGKVAAFREAMVRPFLADMA
jgi:hypothetical protein